MTQRIRKKLETALLVGMLLAICISGVAAYAQGCYDIRQNVLRLHILANSDSQEDQELKLRVRDRVLACSEDLFYDVDSLAGAQECVDQQLDEIRRVAQEEVYAQGYDYPVQVEHVRMFFDTREYDDFVMPAGNYDAVRITIGEAKGKNWWCVLYPPLCLPAAEDKEEVFTPEQEEIIEKPVQYEVKFKIVEIAQTVGDFFDHLFH